MTEVQAFADAVAETLESVRMPVVVHGETVPTLWTDADRDRAAEILLGPDGGAAVLANIRLKASDPRVRSPLWARVYAEIVGWTGNKAALLAWMIAQLGVGLAVAQAAVRQVQRAPNDPAEIARMCREYLAWYEGPQGPGRGQK